MQSLREKIDKIDDLILELLAQRVALAQEIGKIKTANAKDIIDLSRQEEIIQRLSEKKLLSTEQIRCIYQSIFTITQQTQKDFQ